MQFFRLYQYLVPILLFPLCYALWLVRYDYDHRLTLLVLSIPIVFSYVVPGLGTNWLKIWEFNTRWRLGRFRPQHGFLFGTATSMFGLLCLRFPPEDFSVLEIIRAGFIMGSVLAFWNWLYDVHAIRVGFLVVYNLAYSKNRGPEAIATEYCPVFFGIFGLCYGMSIRVCEYYLAELGRFDIYWLLLVACHAVVLVCPVAAYMLLSLLTTGEAGLRSYQVVPGREEVEPAPQATGSSSANPQESSSTPGAAR